VRIVLELHALLLHTFIRGIMCGRMVPGMGMWGGDLSVEVFADKCV
jgi:hypothetical protein